MNYKGLGTKALHAGQVPDPTTGSRTVPIYQTSSYCFRDTEHAANLFSLKEMGNIYTRLMNPTTDVFEQRVAALEGGSGALAHASGAAAIANAIFNIAGAGDHIVSVAQLYGGTYNLFRHTIKKLGIEVTFVDAGDPEAFRRALRPNTKAFFGEGLGNPALNIFPFEEVGKIAKEAGVPLIIDNTCLSPLLNRPIEWGANVVVHSTTKYICGHGDAVAGVAVAKDPDYVKTLKFGYMCELGGVLSPFNAWLLLRGLKTLGLRMRQHCANAERVAAFLADHPKVQRVFYPGLEGSPGRETAMSQMSGFGAIISFEVKGGLAAASRAVDAAELFPIAVSLGDCETLIQLPAAMTHRGYDRERLAEFGLTESMVRLSVGLEDSDDIVAELDRMLAEA